MVLMRSKIYVTQIATIYLGVKGHLHNKSPLKFSHYVQLQKCNLLTMCLRRDIPYMQNT